MRTNILQSVAVALGICSCAAAQAQYGGYPTGPASNSQQYAAPQTQFYQAPANYAPQGMAGSGQSTVPVHPSLRALPPVAPQPMAAAPQWNQPNAGGQQFPAAQFPSAQFPSAQFPAGAQAPGAFNSPYRTVGSDGMNVSGAVGSGHIHQPLPEPVPAPYGGQMGGGYPAPAATMGDGNCNTCNTGSVYHDAAAAPWVGSAPIEACGPAPMISNIVPVRNWFAGSSLLFLDFESDCNRRLLLDDAAASVTRMNSNQVDPGSTLGFETFIGRYFGCGRYAVTASYFFLNPDQEELTVMPPAPGGYRATFPTWDRMYIDRDNDGIADDVGVPGPADDNLYGVYDAATDYRVRRDVEFQGLELNFVAFAIGGAQRAGCLSGCGPGACGPQACGPCGPTGCGGMGGPMIPSCTSRTQVMFSHGIRWFQFRDSFEFAASATDMVFGNGIDDYYYNVDTENNLLGYQFGARINYCLTARVNAYAGAKFGIYGNDIDYRSRIGTRDVAAQVGAPYPAYQGQRVNVNRDETTLATLGELDLGLGVRLTNCWTLTGGYRLLGVTGVATSVGNISNDPAHLDEGHLTCLNDSLLLHGGYVGLQYNW